MPKASAIPFESSRMRCRGIGAELLSDDAPSLDGFSQGADFIVHQAAHAFRNCKRTTFGLKEAGPKVWLLNIEYKKRESFAYSCEAYSRVLELGKRPADRRALADEFSRAVSIANERIVRTAGAAFGLLAQNLIRELAATMRTLFAPCFKMTGTEMPGRSLP